MSLDDLNITIDFMEDVEIKVDTSDVELTLDQPPDVITLIPPDEIYVMIETNDIGINLDNQPPNVELTLDVAPDVIVLPATGLRGPPGPEGPEGPEGPRGTRGATGSTGPAGVDGAPGPAGADSTVPGPQGPQGLKGDTGLTGPTGPVSTVPGPTGPTGPAGADSTVPGPQGPQGVKGDTGNTGPTGATGAQGPQGVKGDTGNTGAQGPIGNTGAQGPIGNTGAQGPVGTPGEKWSSGTGAPAGGVGAVGDWYLNDANGDIYEKTGTSTWTLRDNLTGPQGATGATGTTGATGAQGPQGVKGDTGATGPMGTVYDSDQIGVIKAYSGRTIPTNWVLAVGGTYAKATYPDGWAFAKAERDAGNTAWNYTATDFTVPNLSHQFIYGANAPAEIGGVGGEASHILTAAEMPSHVHDIAHGHVLQMAYGGQANTAYPTGGGGTVFDTSSTSPVKVNSGGSSGGAGGGAAHNNLPPYVILAWIVKITGVTINAGGALVGATGPQGVAGPQGSQGPQGVAGPTGPAGSAMPLDVRRLWGTPEAYTSAFTGSGQIQVYRDGSNPMRFNFTPSVNCWWDCQVQIGLLQKLSAEYTYLYGGMMITPTDADGIAQALELITQHASVQQFEGRATRRIFKLNGGTAYQLDAIMTGGSGGSWQYFQGKSQLWMEAIAWAR